MLLTEQDSELSKSGILGLHALLQKKLCYLKSHMSSVRQLYGSVLDNCEVCEKLQDDDYTLTWMRIITSMVQRMRRMKMKFHLKFKNLVNHYCEKTEQHSLIYDTHLISIKS